MASYFNMKGTTQSEFSIGAKGPILSRIYYQQTTPYLLLPANTIGEKIVLDQTDDSSYIDKTNYTGNAATATKLSTKALGLSIAGISITHVKPDGSTTGLSDGSDLIYGNLVSIDASKLVVGESNAGVPYAVISGLVESGDLNGNDTENKVASSIHTHSQYLSTEAFTITTKDGNTELGQIFINEADEAYAVASQTAKLELNIRDGSIVTANLNDGIITTGKLADGAVTNGKIENGAIGPSKLQDIAGDFIGDYSQKIAKVASAVTLDAGGNIGAMPLSTIFVTSNSALTTKVQTAELADTAVSLKAADATNNSVASYPETVFSVSANETKTGREIISAIKAVASASQQVNAGYLVKWSATGIDGNAATATSAGKLTTAVTLWGNPFDGSASVGVSGTAANIAYTGNITPDSDNSKDLGSSSLRYKNIYGVSATLNGATITKITIPPLTAGDTESNYGIEMNSHSINNANFTNVIKLLPSTTSGQGKIGGTNSGEQFKAIYIDSASHLYWGSSGGNFVNLSDALSQKANTSHTHNIADLSCSAPGSDGYITLTGDTLTSPHDSHIKIATSTHKHTMSDITDIAGIYQFKGVVNSVTTDNNGNITPDGTIPSPETGHVYNVRSDFVYQGEAYAAGTNIVYEKDIPIDNTDPVQYTGVWKPLGGTFDVDLDNFVTNITNSHFVTQGYVEQDNQNPNAWESTTSAVAGTITTYVWYTANRQNNSHTLSTILPRAAADRFGMIQLGYNAGSKEYPLVLDSDGKAYVSVPWVNHDTVDTYSVLVTSSKAGNSNTSSISNGNVFIKLLQNRSEYEDGNTNPTVRNPVVAKTINVVGTGQANVTYGPLGGDSIENNGTLTINVPNRGGYDIPLIKCVADTDTVSNGYLIYTVESTGNSTVVGDNASIKNNSLILVYIEHIEKMYQSSLMSNGNVNVKIKIPATYFYFEKGTGTLPVDVDSVASNSAEYVECKLIHKTNYAAGIHANQIDNPDLSNKLFLAYISLGNDQRYNGEHVIVIMDDVGAKIDNVEPPSVYFDSTNNQMKLLNVNSNKPLLSLVRRYDAIDSASTGVYVRTYRQDANGTFIAVPGLDHKVEVSSGSVTSDVIHSRDSLFSGIASGISDAGATTLNNVHFNDDIVMNASTAGLIKSHGNIDLSTFTKATYQKKYARDYTKIKYQYIVKFHNSTIVLGGKMSYDEVTVSKNMESDYNASVSPNMISIDVNKENVYA